MVSLTTDVPLGTGAYTVNEVACFARMHSVTVRRWFSGNNMGKAIMPDDSPKGFLTFIDFVQALAVRNLRVNHHVALSTIRESLQYAKKEFGLDHPFARRHLTYLDGRQILIRPDTAPIALQATGRGKGQHVMKPILETYLLDISFDPDSGLAKRYLAYQFKDRRVLMDPDVQFGQPYVESAGISARRLAEAVQEEGGFVAAAEAFGVDIDDVVTAHRFIDELRVA
jgi:uncharacterized protein (DUF433 family)